MSKLKTKLTQSYIDNISEILLSKIFNVSEKNIEDITLPIDFDQCFKSLNIVLKEDEEIGEYPVFGAFRFKNNKATLLLNKNIPLFEKSFFKALAIGCVIYSLYSEDDKEGFMILNTVNEYIDDILNKNIVLEDRFIFNFAISLMIPKSKLKLLTDAGIKNKDVLANMFNVSKILIDKRLNILS